MTFVQPQVSYLFIFPDEHMKTTGSNDNSYMQDFTKFPILLLNLVLKIRSF